ncbi:GGDEF domain-containing protein [Vibrio nigripulchritudo]|uniref:GGDEF domain-containing protein n=1 Tax=Vibrio nigripulchritudo TaxID=28173 RepID=UPI0005F9AC49|nr:GGDEF domain-containing protein [Vibrio nigripulchritudo]KJY76368.1 diguanylate cyclase [Vibrio nigripulchritudo]
MTIPAINANLVRFLFPLFLVTGVLYGIDYLTPLVSQNQGAIGFLPYVLFSIALVLCHSFNQGRMGMIAVAMMLAYLVIQERLQVPLNTGTTKLEFSILAFLMPVSCMTVYLFPNKRFFSNTGLAYLALLGLFIGWAFLTIEHFSVNGMEELWDGILFSLPQVSKLPFLAVLYSVIFVGVSAIMVLTRREALDYAVYNCLLLSTVTFGFFQISFISAVFFSLAGVLLIYNIMSTSHSLAFIDQLTEIPSRRALENEMGHLGRSYSIAMLDVDHFKKFNDTHGHDTGDDVLRLVAKQLKKVEGKAKVYRYGGEEFTVLFKGKSAEETMQFLEDLRESVADYDMIVRNRSDRPKDDKLGSKKRGSTSSEKTVNVTISIGVADNSEIKHPKKVLKAADEALYKAKKNGRNCVVCS